MVRMLLIWALLVAGAVMCARQFPIMPAIGVWSAIAAGLCILGSLLIARQPLGRATTAGMIGGSVVRFGYRVGRGKLPAAVAISWFFWVVVGSATIGIYNYRHDLWACLLLLAWLVDGLALAYIVRIMLTAHGNGRIPPSLIKVTAVIALILIGSIVLNAVGTPWSQRSALLLAGGPTLLVGGGYGLFVLVILTVGKNARWN